MESRNSYALEATTEATSERKVILQQSSSFDAEKHYGCGCRGQGCGCNQDYGCCGEIILGC
jgi:hypothetical protein